MPKQVSPGPRFPASDDPSPISRRSIPIVSRSRHRREIFARAAAARLFVAACSGGLGHAVIGLLWLRFGGCGACALISIDGGGETLLVAALIALSLVTRCTGFAVLTAFALAA